MDSDGYVDEFGRCEFVNMREDISWAVHELAASLGLRPTRRKKRAMLNGIDHGPAFQVKFTPRRLPVFRLARKLARMKTDDRGHEHRSVRAVRPVPTVPVRCIQVSAPSGMFLIGDSYVPTHNSSLGRLGLLTHSTAGFVDPGFSGHITLELSNVANLPITLWPGMKIGQLCMFRLTSPAEHPYGSAVYGSRYQDQRGPDAVPVLPQLHPRGDPSSAPDVHADRRLGAGHLQDVVAVGRSTTSPGRTGSPRRRRTARAS